jgi:homoaconitase/3-isopropylmalate dehydratase large subunit
MGQTVAEKALSAHNLSGAAVRAGEGIDAAVDGLLVINYHTIRAEYRRMGYPDGPPAVFDPARVFVMNEHVQPPRSVAMATGNRASRRDAERLGIEHFVESEPGVCHQMMLDRELVRPGQLVAGNDSHVTAYGGVNAAGFGVGALTPAGRVTLADHAVELIALAFPLFVVPGAGPVRHHRIDHQASG